MKNLIKTEVLLDDSGREFNTGRHKYHTMYMKPLSKEEALERFDRGERVYFIYTDNHTMWIYDKKICRKVCKDRDYLKDHYDFYNEVCAIPMPLNVLLDEEYNVLHRLAQRSGMECWFWPVSRGGKDVVQDLEENKFVALKNALPTFVEGLTDLSYYSISKKEEDVFVRLVDRFGLMDVYNARLA